MLQGEERMLALGGAVMLATQRVLRTIVWTLWATHTRKLQGEERMLALGGAVMLATQRVLRTIVWTLWATHTRKLQGEERGCWHWEEQ